MAKPNFRVVENNEMSPSLSMKCSHCKGTGIVQMNGVFADTLALLRKQSKPMNGVELARLANCNPTAMNNRLVWLETRGFATGQRYGRSRRWKANA